MKSNLTTAELAGVLDDCDGNSATYTRLAATRLRELEAENARLREGIKHGTLCMCEPCRSLRAQVHGVSRR